MKLKDPVGRVALLNDSFPPQIDGVANTAINYARVLEEKYGGALVITPHFDKAEKTEKYSFPVIRYPSLDTRKRFGYRFGIPVSPKIVRGIEKHPVALFHSLCPAVSAIVTRELQSIYHLPTVLTYNTKYDMDIRDLVRHDLTANTLIRMMINNINTFDEVWTVSEGAAENLRSLGYEGETLVMPNGVDIPYGRSSQAQINAACAGYDLPQDVPLFLFVGRMIWSKGVKLILDALAALKAQETDFRAVLIGDGRDFAEMKAYAEAQKLTDKCCFTGYLSDREALRAWYTRANLLLFPSDYDTNGLVVREAAATDTPCVLLRGSCAAEGIGDGETGFLIDKTAESLAKTLEALAPRLDYVRAVGERAGREIYFTWEQAVGLAHERYAVVLDNYRCGKYENKHVRFDTFWKTQAKLMKTLAGKK